MEKTIIPIHEEYVHRCREEIFQRRGAEITTENKNILYTTLQTLATDYKEALALLEKTRISEADAENRNLIPLTELINKLIQDISNQLLDATQAPSSMKQLVDALYEQAIKNTTTDLLENLNITIPEPDIQGTVEQITEIILPPDLATIILGSGNGREKNNHPAGHDKIGLVEEWLSSRYNRPRTTMHWKEGILRANQMRQVSYYQLYLAEADATLLLNNQYGEGVFLVRGNFTEREASKSVLKQSPEVISIRFDYAEPMNFLTLLEVYLGQIHELEVIEEKEETDHTTEVELPKQKTKKETLTKEEIKQGLDDLGGYAALMKYTIYQITRKKKKKIPPLKIKGHGITALAKRYGFESKFDLNINTPSGFQEFISFVYGQEFVYKKKEITVEEIKQGLDELGGYVALMKYIDDQINGNKKKQIPALQIKGYGIIKLATRYGFQTKFDLNINTPSGFQEFISYLYGKEFVYEKKEITVEEIKEGLDELGGYATLMKYTAHQITGNKQKDIPALQIKGYGITKLATRYGFASKFDLRISNSSGFQEFISYVYEKQFVYRKEELTVVKIKQGLDELRGYNALMKYTRDQIVGNKQKDIPALQIKGYGIIKLATRYGFQTKFDLRLDTPSGFQEFISYVYEQPFTYTLAVKEEKKEITQNEIKRHLDSLGGYESLMKYTIYQIQGNKKMHIPGLKIKGHGVTTIATRYGFASKFDLRLETPSGFQEFISYVYEQPFTYTLAVKEEKKEITQNEIKQHLDSLGGYEKLFKYTVKNILSLKIKGHGITSLTKKYGFLTKYGLLSKTSILFQEFISFVYGKEFVYEKKEITVEEIKQGLDDLGGYEALMQYREHQIQGNKQKDIPALQIKGYGITKIATRYGFVSKFDLQIQTSNGFQEFISFVYEKEFVYEKKEITVEEIKQGLDDLGGYEILMQYTIYQIQGNKKKDIPSLQIKGHGIKALATKLGFQSKFDGYVTSLIGFQEFISFVYDQPFTLKK